MIFSDSKQYQSKVFWRNSVFKIQIKRWDLSKKHIKLLQLIRQPSSYLINSKTIVYRRKEINLLLCCQRVMNEKRIVSHSFHHRDRGYNIMHSRKTREIKNFEQTRCSIIEYISGIKWDLPVSLCVVKNWIKNKKNLKNK